MNFKKICMAGVACLAVGVLITPSVVSASSNNTDNSDEQSEFIKAYNTGKEKGILTDQNMTQSEFLSLCKESVFPAYLEYQQTHPTVPFAEYVADDNYEVLRYLVNKRGTIRSQYQLLGQKVVALFFLLLALHLYRLGRVTV